MSSVATVCRLSCRIAARSARRKAATRAFSKSTAPCAAQNFTLPALSPTMTEGGIASWKVKEGDSFSTGDVLLEIETDKAQMDVEAQDDGIVFKILEQDGAKGIKVGARIAVLAEPGDDLSTLEVPKEDNASEAETTSSSASSDKSEKKEESAPESKPSSSPPSQKQESSSSGSDSSHGKLPSQKYPLYPSVQYLLHTLGVSSSDAAKISATGPNGRLLKGDVLAHLGKIEKSYPAEQSKRITKLGHLDLSNIKVAAPKKHASAAAAPPTAAAAPAEPEKPTQLSLPISLAAVFATQKRIQDSLGLTLPLSTFIARASEIANEALPRAPTQPTADELFDAVLGLDKLASSKAHTTTRGHYIPQITALPPISTFRPSSVSVASKKSMDIIDLLSGDMAKPGLPNKASNAAAAAAAARGAIPGARSVAGADNMFSVSARKGEERRAMAYLERVKTVLEVEPGRCVL